MAAAGQIVRAERAARRLSQSEIAAGSGIGRTTLSEIERGIRPATLKALHAIADALGIDPAVLRARYYSAGQ